jgi:D-glycero-D-manno-heptose 1,7-bisphosphate phosphatase
MDAGRAAVFLDRDGVLNHPVIRDGKPYPPQSVGDLSIYVDAAGALHALKKAGFVLVVVTNQPDVARGTQRIEAIEAINDSIRAALPVDSILVCYHDDREGCACRKPKPGLLLDAAKRHALALDRSFMVGDRWRDVEAGRAAGVRTILIKRDYFERSSHLPPNAVVSSIADAADWIIRESNAEESTRA